MGWGGWRAWRAGLEPGQSGRRPCMWCMARDTRSPAGRAEEKRSLSSPAPSFQGSCGSPGRGAELPFPPEPAGGGRDCHLRHTPAISSSFPCQARPNSRATDLAGPVSFRTYANVVSLSTPPLPPPPRGPFPSPLTQGAPASDTQRQAARWPFPGPSYPKPRRLHRAGPSISNTSG